MKILVTGGAGYVGSVSVERLLQAGHEVIVLDDLTTGHAAAVAPGARLVRGSYGDVGFVADLIRREGVDAILHCAARSVVPESILDPAKYYRDNVAGGIALLEATRLTGVTRIVFSSTAAVYGTPATVPIHEDAPLAPINPYGETKRTFEAALRWYAVYGIRSVSLRYFNVAGASPANGEVHDPETHLIPNVLRAAETGAAVRVFGSDYPTSDGTCVRDYIDVRDLAEAHLAAVDATAPGDPRTEAPEGAARAIALNLGSAAGFSVREVVTAAGSVVGRQIQVEESPRRAGDPPVLVAANGSAREILGWSARHGSLAEMIGSAWEWRRRHPGGYSRPG